MLRIWVDKKNVGAVDRNPDDPADYDFAYAQQIEAGAEVSLTMPHTLESYKYENGLHPIFQMNLPEGELRQSIERKFRKHVKNYDDLTLLELVGRSQIGRLRYGNDPQQMDAVPQQSVTELLTYDGSENIIQDLLNRFSDFSGVSGVQPKVLIRDGESFSKASDDPTRLTYRGATHIVKASEPSSLPYLAVNEYYCMRAAGYSGLDVPRMALSNNNLMLVVERFDLGEDGRYVGFEDFCVLSGLGTKDKYTKSCEHLAKTINAFITPELRPIALESFFKSVALSSAVRNGDAHLKNFGVLYDATDKEVRLSPTYDIVTTTPYIKGDTFALTMEGSKRFPDADKLVRFGKLHCNLQPSKSKEILQEVAEAVLKARNELQEHIRSDRRILEIGDAISTDWDAGIDNACVFKEKAKQGLNGSGKYSPVVTGSTSGH